MLAGNTNCDGTRFWRRCFLRPPDLWFALTAWEYDRWDEPTNWVGRPNVAEGRPTFFRRRPDWQGMFLPAGREEPLPAAFNLRLNIAYIVRIIQHEIG